MIISVRKRGILSLPFLAIKERKRNIVESSRPSRNKSGDTLLNSYERLLNIQTDLLIRQMGD